MGCAASSEAEASRYETKQLRKQPIADGTVVRISGLESRADLNGRHGLVSGWRVESDRLIINVRGELVALRVSNLAPAPDALAVGTRVRMHGLVNQPEHNGKSGAVVSFNQQSGRNRVRLTEPPHRELALKRSNLELIADDVTPALMPTGGNEGTQDANSALGSAFRTGGQSNAKHAPSALHRNKSEASMLVLSELSKLQQQLTALQVRAAALEAEVGGGGATLPVGWASKLATLHGEARALLEQRVDAVLTTALHSGQQKARGQKKQLAQQAEALIDKLEALRSRSDAFDAEVSVVAVDSAEWAAQGGPAVEVAAVMIEDEDDGEDVPVVIGDPVVTGEWVD